ncbi:MAG: type IVB secretion system protein IcmJDotN [Alphaproteobacteria bacterium]|nr:type IVB secretion system protein IcmJDotN [Alphaproteobacteria bacterium]
MDRVSISLGISRSLGNAKKKKSGAGQPGSTSSDGSDGFLKELRQKIFERDDHTCRCCDFKAKKYQELLHLNGDVQDFSEDNLATACIFCHQCFHLDLVSTMRSGVLLWLPEIEQTDLNHIARAVYVARISQGPMAESARTSLDALMKRREVVRSRIGTDDPYILSMVLKDYLSDSHYSGRGDKLDGIRLFPLDRRIIKEADLEFNQFPQILAYWRSKDGPFGGKPPQQWFNVYHQIQSAA